MKLTSSFSSALVYFFIFKFETLKYSVFSFFSFFGPQKYLYFKFSVCFEIFQNLKILNVVDIFHATNCIQVEAKNLHVKMFEPSQIDWPILTEWQLWDPSLALSRRHPLTLPLPSSSPGISAAHPLLWSVNR